MTLLKKIIILSGKYKGIAKLNRFNGIEELVISGVAIENKSYVAICQDGVLLELIPINRNNIKYTTACSADHGRPVTIIIVNASCEIMAYGATDGMCDLNTYLSLIATRIYRITSDESMACEAVTNAAEAEIEIDLIAVNNNYDELQSSANIGADTYIDAVVDNATHPAFVNVMQSDNDDEMFYHKVSAQIEELFQIYPHDLELEDMVQGSKWVRIDYDERSYYVVGIISEDDIPQFICYGAPAENYSDEHENFGSCEWLPLDRNNPKLKGYWVLYQSALNGDMLTP